MAATDSDTQPIGTTPKDDARPACTWDICRSPRTGKCFAWCKCICHEWSAARARDIRRQRAETTTATVEDAARAASLEREAIFAHMYAAWRDYCYGEDTSALPTPDGTGPDVYDREAADAMTVAVLALLPD